MSRDLDAKAAERIMGWVWRKSNATGRRCLYPENSWPEWMDSPADGSEPLVGDWDTCSFGFEPSCDIVAATKLTDAMIARGWRIYIDGPRFDDREWRVMFSRDRVNEWRSSDLLPLAITQAALAATDPHRDNGLSVENLLDIPRGALPND